MREPLTATPKSSLLTWIALADGDELLLGDRDLGVEFGTVWAKDIDTVWAKVDEGWLRVPLSEVRDASEERFSIGLWVTAPGEAWVVVSCAGRSLCEGGSSALDPLEAMVRFLARRRGRGSSDIPSRGPTIHSDQPDEGAPVFFVFGDRIVQFTSGVNS